MLVTNRRHAYKARVVEKSLEGPGPWTVSGFCEGPVKQVGCTVKLDINGVTVSMVTPFLL
jgi:hypothetical protein